MDYIRPHALAEFDKESDKLASTPYSSPSKDTKTRAVDVPGPSGDTKESDVALVNILRTGAPPYRLFEEGGTYFVPCARTGIIHKHQWTHVDSINLNLYISGQLTEAVRRKPYAVILLDELEKAHKVSFFKMYHCHVKK